MTCSEQEIVALDWRKNDKKAVYEKKMINKRMNSNSKGIPKGKMASHVCRQYRISPRENEEHITTGK